MMWYQMKGNIESHEGGSCGTKVRARLTARGFEEKEKVASDSPTIDKCNVRIVLAICQSKGWVLETSV